MQYALVKQSIGWISILSLFFRQTIAIFTVEIKKLLRDPTEIFSRAFQPFLWLLIFGEVFSHLHEIPTGGINYLAYITPGILAQSILFSAIFYGLSVIWERDLGIVYKLLVSPAFRGSLVLGKALSAGIRGLVQGIIVYILALSINIPLHLGLIYLINVIFCILLGSALFSTFSLMIACIVKTRERFMGIGQVITMPLFFASNAIYPIQLMPTWLRVAAKFNPLTYLVDLLRKFMIIGGHNLMNVFLDYGVLLGAFIILTYITSKIYAGIIR
jgi:ABC-2 type transport system permease protein